MHLERQRPYTEPRQQSSIERKRSMHKLGNALFKMQYRTKSIGVELEQDRRVRLAAASHLGRWS